jgi:hypothetical protein
MMFVDGESEANAQKKPNGATVPAMPMSTDMSAASSAEKGLLRSSSNAEMSEK